jgi:trimethylamine:corrinoid methyltransferase-like protein
MVSPMQVDTGTLLEDVGASVGIGSEYLSQLETLYRCHTEFFLPRLMRVMTYQLEKMNAKVFNKHHLVADRFLENL